MTIAIDPDTLTCPSPSIHPDQILLGHGSGGTMSADLMRRVFLPAFHNETLAAMEDQATVADPGLADGGRLAFTTDSYVVRPIFFPGGDIGKLAVHGTVNDLAVGGARPLYLSAAFILEEGLAIADLRRVVRSMREACDEAGVSLVTGDTKVVDRGKGDRIFIATSGIGVVPRGRSLSIRNARPGDRVLLSGTLGDHGIAILSVREGIEFETVLRSDTAPLNGLAAAILDACPDVRSMRDLTRGGLSSALNELAAASGVGIRLDEAAIPVRPEVRAACELFGLDPLYVANEGKLIAVVPPGSADRALWAARAHPLGRDAALIGEVVADHRGMVTMTSPVGGRRLVTMIAGEHLPQDLLMDTNRQPPTSPGTVAERGGPLRPIPEELDVLWLTAGLSCDGDTIAITAATQPSLEDLIRGAIPGIPRLRLHNPVLAYENGDEFLEIWHRAARGDLEPFVLVVEGSIPNEAINDEGCWAAFGSDPATGQPIPTCSWIDRLAPRAWAVVAAGICAAYGGIHAMAGNPTGCMGLPDYLGKDWRSAGGLPIVCVPGCPVQPDNFMETLLYLLYQASGLAPAIPLDDHLRPRWLFAQTVHEGCDRAGYYEQADFTDSYGAPQCIVKLGCWGPVVHCNVGKRGWMNGIGGCPNVGGICIGCTMPGFPDKFMPFMDEPPGAKLSTTAVSMYGRTIRALRSFTKASMGHEPDWRHRRPELTTGYRPTTNHSPIANGAHHD